MTKFNGLLLFFHMICICIIHPTFALNNNIQNDNNAMSRRYFALHVPASVVSTAILSTSPAYATATKSSYADRFESDILQFPPITAGVPSKESGHENLYFPAWMEGEWNAKQTLISTKAPLGLKYIGGPQADINIAKKTMDEQEKRINEEVNLKLRFINTKFGVVEDRAFNLKSRLNAFAGKEVVASVEYADVKDCNRASVLAAGGKETDPLSTTLVYFKGPAAQKTFLISHGEAPLDNDDWFGYETLRSIFALTNQSTAPPVTTDQEAIYSFKKVDNDRIEGMLRLAGYLNPQADTLYFDAKQRAVSLTDYTLSLKRATS